MDNNIRVILFLIATFFALWIFYSVIAFFIITGARLLGRIADRAINGRPINRVSGNGRRVVQYTEEPTTRQRIVNGVIEGLGVYGAWTIGNKILEGKKKDK